MATLDIRGTNGSGKSWIVRQLLATYENSMIGVGGKTIGYCLPKLSCAVIGRYTTTGGGCDGFKGGVVEVEEHIRSLHSQHDNLILEGIMVSHLYERFHKLASELPGYKFLFLNTPLGNCIARVRARRWTKGNRKPFDPTRNLIKDYNRIWHRVRGRLKDAGHYVRVLDWKNPIPIVLQELNNNALG